MPKYTAVIRCDDGRTRLVCTRPDLLHRWLNNNLTKWVWLELEPISKNPNPKTAEQLGYYWGLLVIEITEQLNTEGLTIPVRAFNLEYDRPYFKNDTHELLTQLCGRIGVNGALIRVSEMGKFEMMKFLDNVLKFAVANLNMNGQRLEAWITKMPE